MLSSSLSLYWSGDESQLTSISLAPLAPRAAKTTSGVIGVIGIRGVWRCCLEGCSGVLKRHDDILRVYIET